MCLKDGAWHIRDWVSSHSDLARTAEQIYAGCCPDLRIVSLIFCFESLIAMTSGADVIREIGFLWATNGGQLRWSFDFSLRMRW